LTTKARCLKRVFCFYIIGKNVIRKIPTGIIFADEIQDLQNHFLSLVPLNLKLSLMRISNFTTAILFFIFFATM
jgi:hypothetical protein